MQTCQQLASITGITWLTAIWGLQLKFALPCPGFMVKNCTQMASHSAFSLLLGLKLEIIPLLTQCDALLSPGSVKYCFRQNAWLGVPSQCKCQSCQGCCTDQARWQGPVVLVTCSVPSWEQDLWCCLMAWSWFLRDYVNCRCFELLKKAGQRRGTEEINCIKPPSQNVLSNSRPWANTWNHPLVLGLLSRCTL